MDPGFLRAFAPGRLSFPELVAGPEEVEEDRLVGASFAQLEVVTVHRRFRPVAFRDIAPSAPGGEDVEDPVEEVPGVPAGPADTGLPGREVPLDNLPEVVVNLPECHEPRHIFGGLILM